jgi:hypothetical protein
MIFNSISEFRFKQFNYASVSPATLTETSITRLRSDRSPMRRWNKSDAAVRPLGGLRPEVPPVELPCPSAVCECQKALDKACTIVGVKRFTHHDLRQFQFRRLRGDVRNDCNKNHIERIGGTKARTCLKAAKSDFQDFLRALPRAFHAGTIAWRQHSMENRELAPRTRINSTPGSDSRDDRRSTKRFSQTQRADQGWC